MSNPNEYYRKKRAAILIHAFAVAHAAAAFACAQLLVADKVILTGLTTAMIISLALLFQIDMDRTTAIAIAALVVCEFLGIYAALLIVQWIPVLGNAANAAATFTVTEVIGWGLYTLFSYMSDNEKHWQSLSDAEKKRLIKEAMKGAKHIAGSENKRMKTLLKKLTPEDRAEYKRIEKAMRKIKASKFKDDAEQEEAEKERLLLIAELEDLLNRYDFE